MLRRVVCAVLLGWATAASAETVFGVGQWTGEITCPKGGESVEVREVPLGSIPLEATALVGISGWTYNTFPVHYLIIDFFHNGGTEHWLNSRFELLEGLRSATTNKPAQWVPFILAEPGHTFTGGGVDRLYVRIRCLPPAGKTAAYQVFINWQLRVAP